MQTFVENSRPIKIESWMPYKQKYSWMPFKQKPKWMTYNGFEDMYFFLCKRNVLILSSPKYYNNQGLRKVLKSGGSNPKSGGAKTRFRPKFVYFWLFLLHFWQKWGGNWPPCPPASEGPVKFKVCLRSFFYHKKQNVCKVFILLYLYY